MGHVGMDLHTKTMYLRAYTDAGELLPGRKVYCNDLRPLWEYLDQFGDEPVRVVFEAVGNARWMYRLLSDRPNLEPVAVTPHKVKIVCETVAKTDKIDAEKLAWLSKVDALPRAWMPDERIEALRELVRHRARLVQGRTRAKNEINGLLVRCGLTRPYDDIFGTLGRRWLAAVEFKPPMRLQLENWLESIDWIEPKIVALEGRIRRMLQRDPQWAQDLEVLDSLPGLGLVSIATILAELGDYRRFRSRSEVAAYAGLVPRSKRSDKTKRYGKLSKQGSPELRRVLTQVAQGVARRVPRYGQLYERIAREKHTHIAKSAVARRLLEDAWTILIKQEPFRLLPEPAEESLTRVG